MAVSKLQQFPCFLLAHYVLVILPAVLEAAGWRVAACHCTVIWHLLHGQPGLLGAPILLDPFAPCLCILFSSQLLLIHSWMAHVAVCVNTYSHV